MVTVSHAPKDPQRVRALATLDIDDLARIENRDVDRLAGAVAQIVEVGPHHLVEVEVGRHDFAELVQSQSQSVSAVRATAVDEALSGERGEESVDRAFWQAQASRQLGHAKVAVRRGEGAQKAGRVAD